MGQAINMGDGVAVAVTSDGLDGGSLDRLRNREVRLTDRKYTHEHAP